MIRTSFAQSAAFSGEKPVATRRATGYREEHGHGRDDAEIDRQRRHDAVGERVGGVARLVTQRRDVGGDERRRARPRRRDRAAGWEDAERREERVAVRARAQREREDLLAHEAKQPREHGQRAHAARAARHAAARVGGRRGGRHSGLPLAARSSAARSRTGEAAPARSFSSSARSAGVPAAATQPNISTASSGMRRGRHDQRARRARRLLDERIGRRRAAGAPSHSARLHTEATQAALTPGSGSVIPACRAAWVRTRRPPATAAPPPVARRAPDHAGARPAPRARGRPGLRLLPWHRAPRAAPASFAGLAASARSPEHARAATSGGTSQSAISPGASPSSSAPAPAPPPPRRPAPADRAGRRRPPPARHPHARAESSRARPPPRRDVRPPRPSASRATPNRSPRAARAPPDRSSRFAFTSCENGAAAAPPGARVHALRPCADFGAALVHRGGGWGSEKDQGQADGDGRERDAQRTSRLQS